MLRAKGLERGEKEGREGVRGEECERENVFLYVSFFGSINKIRVILNVALLHEIVEHVKDIGSQQN